jgi:non-ribosomal peptide synthetase component F
MRINVTQYLDKTAELFPDKIAVDDTSTTLTFSELQQCAYKIAIEIIKLNLINSPIAIYMQKSCTMVATFAAVNYSGNFYVPIDIKSPNNRVKNIFETLEAKVILTDADNHNKLKSLYSGHIICVDDICNTDFSPNIINQTRDKIIDTDSIYAIFTSGSTGAPKGVVISHRGVIDYIDWAVETFKIDENTIVANQAPFYFDNSTLDLYLMFATGATLIIVPEEYYTFPARLIDLLNDKKVNMVLRKKSLCFMTRIQI